MLDFCRKRDRKSLLNHQLLLSFRFPGLHEVFKHRWWLLYVRKFTKVKEVSLYSKLSLEFPEELRIYRCGDLRVVQDCFKTISVAAPNVLRSERVSFQNTNSQLDNSKS